MNKLKILPFCFVSLLFALQTLAQTPEEKLKALNIEPTVMNGFSDVMVEVFGEKGKHARSAVGMSSLPFNIAVEVELIVEVEPDGITVIPAKTAADLLRIAELDKTYWAEISRTVKEGDFDGYKATCHENAVLVATAGKNKRSEPMTVALARWKQGFVDTRQGKQMDNVSFRFSQRIGSETTAHETGIFYFSSHDSTGKLLSEAYIHFEELVVKQGDKWQCMMEFQKSVATREEWDALK